VKFVNGLGPQEVKAHHQERRANRKTAGAKEAALNPPASNDAVALTLPDWSAVLVAGRTATNALILLHLAGALLLGLMVGYERSYHGRAAGMRTYGLVCMASCALTIIAGYPNAWYGGHGARWRWSTRPA
jgi:hypothetical protein